jgi:hypothetical protein
MIDTLHGALFFVHSPSTILYPMASRPFSILVYSSLTTNSLHGNRAELRFSRHPAPTSTAAELTHFT